MNRMPEGHKIAAAFHSCADSYDHHVLVQKRVVANLAGIVARQVSRKPGLILDVGTGTGALLERLGVCYPDAGLAGIDIALNMCLRAREKLGPSSMIVNGSAERLPFKNSVFDLVVSASALQWVSGLSDAIHEMARVVKEGGDVTLAFFCDGSLFELQDCFSDAASQRTPAMSTMNSRLHRFWKIDDVKLIAQEMDFEKVVVSVETEVDWYDDLNSLLRSIRSIGAGTVSGGVVSGLGWRGILQEASRLYKERYGSNGRIPATYKVLYLSAHTKRSLLDFVSG